MPILLTTDLPFPIFRRGKVRDVYDLGSQLLHRGHRPHLAPSTASCPRASPTRAGSSPRWPTSGSAPPGTCCPTTWGHRGGASPPSCSPTARPCGAAAILVRRPDPLPVECVVRGYLAGQRLKEYQSDRHRLRHPAPFWPAATRTGCPSPSSPRPPRPRRATTRTSLSQRMAEIVGADLAIRVRDLSLALYRRGPNWPPGGASCWPTPNSSSASLPRGTDPDRRGPDPGQQPLLAGGHLGAREEPAEPGQAVPPGLPGDAAGTGTSSPRRRTCPRRSSRGSAARYLDLAARFGVKV